MFSRLDFLFSDVHFIHVEHEEYSKGVFHSYNSTLAKFLVG